MAGKNKNKKKKQQDDDDNQNETLLMSGETANDETVDLIDEIDEMLGEDVNIDIVEEEIVLDDVEVEEEVKVKITLP